MTDHGFCLEGTSGKGVLLVHGLTGAPAEMKFVARHLHRLGFTVHAPMLAGHCHDEKALLATTFETWLDGLREALAALGRQVDEIHAAGICVGGGLALYLAHLEPDLLRSVVIYSATLAYDGWATPRYYALAPLGVPIVSRMPLMRNIGFAERSPYGIKSERLRHAVVGDGADPGGALSRFPLRALNQNYRLNRALRKALPSIATPTLLIHAREDDVSSPRNAREIQKLHGGACDVVMLEDSYHMLHVDQERRKVAALTADFFLAHGVTPDVAPPDGCGTNARL